MPSPRLLRPIVGPFGPCALADFILAVASFIVLLIAFKGKLGLAPALVCVIIAQVVCQMGHMLIMWFRTRRFPPLDDIVAPPNWTWVLVFVAAMLDSVFGHSSWTVEDMTKNIFIAFLTSGFSLMRQYDHPQILERAVSDSLSAIDVGAGSAQSFWSGYLEDILKNFRDREIHGPENSVCGTIGHTSFDTSLFLYPRLIILVPLNCDMVDNIEESLPRLRNHCPTLMLTPWSVKDFVVDRAGVRSRSMGKHSIYSIDTGVSKTLFAMEWATPCRTMKKMNMSSNELAIQVEAFYHRLLHLRQTKKGPQLQPERDVVFVCEKTMEEALAAMHRLLTEEAASQA